MMGIELWLASRQRVIKCSFSRFRILLCFRKLETIRVFESQKHRIQLIHQIPQPIHPSVISPTYDGQITNRSGIPQFQLFLRSTNTLLQLDKYLVMIEHGTKQHIQEAYLRIQPYIHLTPILQNHSLNSLTKSNIYFKLQNLQKTGSFKVRGVANTVLQLNKPKGLCTHSSGNNGQALAYVGKELNLPVTVVMPRDSPALKKRAVKDYGAQVVESSSLYEDRVRVTDHVINDEGLAFVSSSDDMNIITGNATVAYEMYQELWSKQVELDYILFPIGGGGIASGSILSTKYFSPNTLAIGVEPELAQDAYRSWKSQELHQQLPPVTVADGLRTRLGEIPFQIISRQIHDIILVSQAQIISATKLFMEKTKMVIEPSSAVVIAALLKDQRFAGKRVGAIITGGNIDLDHFFKDLEGKYGHLEMKI